MIRFDILSLIVEGKLLSVSNNSSCQYDNEAYSEKSPKDQRNSVYGIVQISQEVLDQE